MSCWIKLCLKLIDPPGFFIALPLCLGLLGCFLIRGSLADQGHQGDLHGPGAGGMLRPCGPVPAPPSPRRAPRAGLLSRRQPAPLWAGPAVAGAVPSLGPDVKKPLPCALPCSALAVRYQAAKSRLPAEATSSRRPGLHPLWLPASTHPPPALPSPGKSSLHASFEGERVIALESW